MRQALKAGRRFLAANAWKDWIMAEYGDSANATSDADIDAYIRKNALVVNHVSGTVAMGKSGNMSKGAGALNPDLSVKGVKGLRVVDASAFVSPHRFIYFVRSVADASTFHCHSCAVE